MKKKEISTGIPQNGSFTLTDKGKITVSINDVQTIFTQGTVTCNITGPGNVLLYTLSATNSNPMVSGYVINPKEPIHIIFNRLLKTVTTQLVPLVLLAATVTIILSIKNMMH